MGVSDLVTLTGRMIVYTVIVCVIITVFPGLPPPYEPRVIKYPTEKRLEGALGPNNVLDKAEDFMGKDGVGADSIVEDKDGKTIYFGLPGGWICKYDGTFSRVVQTGEQCDILWEERKCGLPLGMRLDKEGNIIVTDALQGVMKVNPKTGEKETIVKIGQMIEGVPVDFPDDMDISSDGSTIYWSQPTEIPPEDGFVEIFVGIPTGRLIKTDLKTGESQVLMKDLMFANGIQLSENEDFLLIGETLQQRIYRYYLKGEKNGTYDIFIDGLPGFQDNIRSNGKGGFLIPILLPRDKSVELIGNYPLVRKFMLRVYALVKMSLQFMHNFLPNNEFLGRLHLGLRYLIFYAGDEKAKSMIIETDGEGNIIGSMQNDKGNVRLVSQAQLGQKYMYLASPTNPMYRVKLSDIPSMAGKTAA